MKALILMDFIREEHFSIQQGKPKFNLLNTPNGKVLKQLLEKCSNLYRNRTRRDYDIDFVYKAIPTPIRNDYGKIIKYQDVKLSEAKQYYDSLTKKIMENKYDIIIPTGKLGTKFLLNQTSISKVRGVPEKITLSQDGKTFDTWVLPTFSIEYTNVNKNAERHVISDLTTLGKFVAQGEEAFTPKEVDYELVTDIERVKEIFKKEVKNDNYDGVDITAWDLETNSLQPDKVGSKPLVVSLSWRNGQGVTIPIYKTDFQWKNGQEDIDTILSLLENWVANKKDTKVGHNIQYDIKFLMSTQGFKTFENHEDTKVGWYLAVTQEQAESLRLSDLAYEATDMGGYDKPLEDYKVWFRNHLLKYLSTKIADIVKKNKKVAKKEYKVNATDYDSWIQEKLDNTEDILIDSTVEDNKDNLSKEEKVYRSLGLTPEILTIEYLDKEELSKVIKNLPIDYYSLEENTRKYIMTTAINLINKHKKLNNIVNEVDGSPFNYDWIPLELMHPYASGDVDCCRRLYCDVIDKLEQQDRPKAIDLLKKDYPRLTRTLARIESNGVYADKEYMVKNDDFYIKEMKKTEKEMKEHWAVKEFEDYQFNLYELGVEEFAKPKKERDPNIEKYRTKFKDDGWMFSPSSGAHKGKVLYDILGLKPPYDKNYIKDKPFEKGIKESDLTWEDYKVNKVTLDYLNEHEENKDIKELLELMLYYASLQTKRNSFTNKLITRINPSTGNIHGNFNISGTSTGRLSSSNINWQNVPAHTSNVNKFDYHHPIKRSFVSRFPGGLILQADYSALELRVTGLITGDESMTQIFLDGGDLHVNTAGLMNNKAEEEVTVEERQDAKKISFGLLYG